MGARRADYAPQWRSLLGTCRATGIVKDGVGITFHQKPQLTNQLLDQKQPARPPAGRGCLAVKGGHRAGHQHDIPRVLQPTVSGSQEDVRSSSGDRPFHSQPPHGSSTLQDGDARICPLDIREAYLHVPMHQAVRKYLQFVVNKQVYQFTCLPFGLATSPREFTKLLQPVVALLRQRGVKLHVYLDDWLIRADFPNMRNCMPRRPSVCSSFSAGSYSKSGLSVH